MQTLKITIPKHQSKFLVSKKTRKTGNPKWWTVNGQSLYNATLHYTLRSRLTHYYHNYLKSYIQTQLSKKDITYINTNVYKDSDFKLSISLHIYEIKKSKIPDIGNMWIWIKWFEDVLQEMSIIPDDNPDYVIQSGQNRYFFVNNEEDRKLIFFIKFLKTKTHE